jgi:hypothetical protein
MTARVPRRLRAVCSELSVKDRWISCAVNPFFRDEVATEAERWGRRERPPTSTWRSRVRLVQNAFFAAILPTFEREAAD